MTTNLLRGKFSTRALTLASMLLLLPAMALAQLVPGQAASDNPVPALSKSVSVDFPNPETTVGHLNIVVVGWSDTTSSVTGVTDAAGNQYVLAAGTNASSAVSQAIYYAVLTAVPTAPTLNTITVKFTQNASFPDVRIFEYQGLDTTNPLEAASGAFGSSSGPKVVNSGSATTFSAKDLIFGAGTTSFGFNGPGTGFTQELLTPAGNIAEDQSVLAVGSYSATASLKQGSWTMQMVAFRGAGQTGPTQSAPTVSSALPSSGPDTGGSPTVTISGTNFMSGATVYFGALSGINCTVTSPTTITCLPPAHPPGSVGITVTNVDGGTFSSSSPLYLYQASTPGINSISPAGGVTNGGTSITISGSNFQSGASVFIDGQPAGGVVVKDAATIQATTTAHNAGAASVTVKNPDGGVSPPFTFTYSKGSGPINFVQFAEDTNPNKGQTESVQMPLSQVAGDLNLVVIGWSDSTHHVTSVVDTNSNPYQPVPFSVSGNGSVSQMMYYAPNIKGGSNTVIVQFSGSAIAPDIRVMEYSGVDTSSPIDISQAGTGFGVLADTGSFTTTHPVDVIVGAATVDTGINGPGPGFILIDKTQPNSDGDEHQFTSAVGTYDAQMPLSSGNWVMQAVAFHAPANVTPPSFGMSASPTTNSVNPGSSASYTISVSAKNGFNAAVALSCSAPANVGISCSVSPSSVTPGSAPASATLTVTTTGPSALLTAPRQNRTPMLPLYALWLPLPGMALAGIGLASRRRKLLVAMALLLVVALALFLASCGGGGSSTPPPPPPPPTNPGTPAGSYTISVSGSSAGVTTQSTPVTLTVQ